MNTKLLAQYLGGSHLYGLDTPNSDLDVREVFMHTDSAYILGTKKFEQETRNNREEDTHKIEIRKFLELAKKGNTQSVEVLYAEERSFDYLDPIMRRLRENREKLIDSDTLYRVLDGFIKSQKDLVFDTNRKAEKGSNRGIAIEKYGYTPKPASHIIRLAYSGINFFQNQYYEVKLTNTQIRTLCRTIKTAPEKFTPDDIKEMLDTWHLALESAYQMSSFKTTFDEEFVNDFLLDSYFPSLCHNVFKEEIEEYMNDNDE